MESLNYTPGPWIICEATSRRIDPLIRDRNGFTVAQAVKPANSRARYINESANARLISAAPELLESLLIVLETHSATGGSAKAAATKAAMAIAKAMGTSNG